MDFYNKYLNIMEQKIKDLILKYKKKIADIQRKQEYYESTGRGGMCVAIQGSIQAYNAVISDLERLL